VIKPLSYFIALGLVNQGGKISCVIYCCFLLQAVVISVDKLTSSNLRQYLPVEEWSVNIREEVRELKTECYKKGFISEHFIEYLNNIDFQVFYHPVFTANYKKYVGHTVIILKSLFWGDASLISWRYDPYTRLFKADRKSVNFTRLKWVDRSIKADKKTIFIPLKLLEEIKGSYNLELPTLH
jgi:hypothetical protein